ncbi:MAG: hypothetical protein Q8O89_08645, partial [Nanoarchaeota archaeon]|nr:hypothetical protein [Nanoarchaeota archaeon]
NHQIHVPFPDPTGFPFIRPSPLRLLSLYRIFTLESFTTASISLVSRGVYTLNIEMLNNSIVMVNQSG